MTKTYVGSGSESGVGGDIAAAGNYRGAAGSVVESTSDGGFLAAGFQGHHASAAAAAGAAPPAYPAVAPPAYPAHC